MLPRAPALAVLAALLALPLLAAGAAAHAVPVEVQPASGAIVRVAPREVVIVMSERLEPAFSRVEVRDANGTTVSGPSSVDGDGLTMRAPLPGLDFGAYTVSWRALSTVDGHATRGITSFLYPDPSKPLNIRDLPPTEGTTIAPVGPADVVLRALLFAGLFAALAAPVLVLVVAGPDPPAAPWRAERQLALAALGGGAIAALAGIALVAAQGASLGAGPLSGRFGMLALARAPLLLGAGALAWAGALVGAGLPRGRTLWWGSAACAVGAVATVSLGSHGAALQAWTELAVANDVLHLSAAAAWVGGVAGLGLVLLRDADSQGWARLAGRFSLLAGACVAVVVGTGIVAMLLQLRGVAGLLGSDYGRILVLKLLMVGGLLAFGARHRMFLRRLAARGAGADAAADGGAGGLRWFRRSVRLEALLGVAVLVAAAGLTALSPPAPAVEAPGAPSVLELKQARDGINATLLLTPNPVVVGVSTVDLFLETGGLADGDAANATMTLVPPDRTLGTSEFELELLHPGHFGGEGSYFAMPGAWKVRFLVQRLGAFDLALEFEVDVRAP